MLYNSLNYNKVLTGLTTYLMTYNNKNNFFFRSLVISGGLYSFVLSKRYVDSKRYDSMKARERMHSSNFGDYEPSPRKF